MNTRKIEIFYVFIVNSVIKCYKFITIPSQFAFLTLERKIRTRGATESQSRNNIISIEFDLWI